MSEVGKSIRLGKAAQEFNVGVPTIVEFLNKKGIKVDNTPNTKLAPEVYSLLMKEYQSEKTVKEDSQKIELEYTQHKTISIADKQKPSQDEMDTDPGEDLFIRNMPVDTGAAKKPKSKTKPAEEPVVEPVAEPVAEVQPVPSAPEPAPEVAPEPVHKGIGNG